MHYENLTENHIEKRVTRQPWTCQRLPAFACHAFHIQIRWQPLNIFIVIVYRAVEFEQRDVPISDGYGSVLREIRVANYTWPIPFVLRLRAEGTRREPVPERICSIPVLTLRVDTDSFTKSYC